MGRGTEALHLVLRLCCGVELGDKVIIVSHTAVEAIAAIETCGAVPVPANIDHDPYIIDPIHVEGIVIYVSNNLTSS